MLQYFRKDLEKISTVAMEIGTDDRMGDYIKSILFSS